MDYSLPGSSVHGIFQARVLEWVAIAFSDVYAKNKIYSRHGSFHISVWSFQIKDDFNIFLQEQ